MRKMWAAGLGLTLLACLAAAPTPQVSGPDLAQRLGCWACHSLQGQGGQSGSPLDFIGARLNRDDLQQVLTHPRSRRPLAKMPSYAHLRPWEMEALVDYLKSLEK